MTRAVRSAGRLTLALSGALSHTHTRGRARASRAVKADTGRLAHVQHVQMSQRQASEPNAAFHISASECLLCLRRAHFRRALLLPIVGLHRSLDLSLGAAAAAAAEAEAEAGEHG